MAKPTFGTTLKMGVDKASATAISERVTISPPKGSREALDATTHGSADGAMEFIPDGVFNPGQLTGTINYVAGSADDDEFIAAFASTDVYYFEFTANAANGTETFECWGVMTEYGPDELPVSGKQTASFAIQISGKPAQAPTA